MSILANSSNSTGASSAASAPSLPASTPSWRDRIRGAILLDKNLRSYSTYSDGEVLRAARAKHLGVELKDLNLPFPGNQSTVNIQRSSAIPTLIGAALTGGTVLAASYFIGSKPTLPLPVPPSVQQGVEQVGINADLQLEDPNAGAAK